MRRMETKRITSSRPSLAITSTYKKNSADVVDVLDTDEDRVMLSYNYNQNSKDQLSLNKRNSRNYHSARN
jgi:hypothetical protein